LFDVTLSPLLKHLAVDFVRILQAFIYALPNTQDGAIGYYSEIQSPLYVVTKVLYTVQTTLGDGVLVCLFTTSLQDILILKKEQVWRLYIVYEKKLWFTAPFMALLVVNLSILVYCFFLRTRSDTFPVVGLICCETVSRAAPGETVFSAARQWIVTFFSLTMCINVLCTGVSRKEAMFYDFS
jgi:hypothetical protein